MIADTKMEFGFIDGELSLIDELLTPDSSRFWDAEGYEPGKSLPNFDKQFVRDWLDDQNWDHEPPAPELPDDVVSRTRERYLEAYHRLTGARRRQRTIRRPWPLPAKSRSEKMPCTALVAIG